VRGIESFTVVVPSYNEAATLRANIETIRTFLVERTPLALPWSIVIVDDASHDETARIAAKLAREDLRIAVVRRGFNGGVDAAIRSGVEAARGDAIVVLDADLSYRAPIVGLLMETLVREGAEVVVASAYAPGGSVHHVPKMRAALSRWANRFLAYAAHDRVHTLTCIVRAYRTESLRALLARNSATDMSHGLLLAALRDGLCVREVPAQLEWAPTRHSRMNPSAIWRRTMDVMGAALRARPSLVLAIPGLIPGLLPLAVLLSIWAHARPAEVGIVASATFAIQTASLIVFGFHSTNFLLRMRRHA
jgi:glycosyltransferase involved in cell wall biosynthesis